MKIGIISNHFSFPAINYLITNNLVAGFAVPEVQNPGVQHIKLISETFNVQFNILHKNTLSEDIINWLSKIGADIVYIFSFPYKIPEEILTMPRFGFINFHPSILPSYRGPDPIFWQLKNGAAETGITAYQLDKDIDTGPIIHIEKEQISPADTYGSLGKKFSETLLRSVTEVTALIKNKDTVRFKYLQQDDKTSSYFGNPKREDLIIEWDKQDAASILNLVRASNPKYQGAITFYKSNPVKILQVSIKGETRLSKVPGTVINSIDEIKIITFGGKAVSIDIVYVNEGFYTSSIFRSLFNVKQDDKFGEK
jgi:methionyl-tRNA formyltransferase